MQYTLLELISTENKKAPYTDEKLAELIGIRREQVIELRKREGIPDSRTRLKPALTAAIKKCLETSPNISDRALTELIREDGIQVSRFLVHEVRQQVESEKNPAANQLAVTAMHKMDTVQKTVEACRNHAVDSDCLPTVEADTGASETMEPFTNMIGWDGSLRAQIHQAKAAIAYPPNGLNVMIIGPSGTGKTTLAEDMYNFAVKQGILPATAPLIFFNCADYAENPQLLYSQLFGYVKGAFSGANDTRNGLVGQADGGILFLDEVHRLSGGGQEMLFYLLDKGAYRRLGDAGPARKVNVRVIVATTSSPESSLLPTFRRRIPIVISMPSIGDRPISERYALLHHIFSTEQKKLGRKLVVEADAVSMLLNYECPGNVGQLQSNIQMCCANAFLESSTTGKSTVRVTADMVGQLLGLNERKRMFLLDMRFEHKMVFPDPAQSGGEEIIQNIDETIYSKIQKAIENIDLSDPSSIEEIRSKIVSGTLRDEAAVIEGGMVRIREQVSGAVDKVLARLAPKVTPIQDNFRSAIISCLVGILNGGDYRIGAEKSLLPQKHAISTRSLANEFLQEFAKEMDCNLPYVATDIVALYLYAFSIHYLNGRVRVIIMTHGKVGEAMADVVNYMLKDDNAIGFSMEWEETADQVLERAIKVVQNVDEGRGCLLLVDMGSLASFAPEITLRTGVRVRCVTRVDTLMALDAVSKASISGEKSLDALADELEAGRLHIGFNGNKLHTGKPPAILTVCMTGEGSAHRIRGFLQATIAGNNKIKLVEVGILNRDALTESVNKICRDYDIVAVVGTINPEIPGVPFLSKDYIFSSQGTLALNSLLEDYFEDSISLRDLLNPSLIVCDREFSDKIEVIDYMCKLLREGGYVTPEFLLSVYKRENIGTTYLQQRIAIPHGEPSFVTRPAICIAKLKNSLEWSVDCVVDYVFMFALTEDCQKYVQKFYELISDENDLKMLMKADSKEEIYKSLK